MKTSLGLRADLPAVLLVGGGEGMGKLEVTVDQIAEKLGGSCQVVVICGRNRKLLESLRAKRYPSGMPVTATGFIDNIHEYMHACDAIVTKAGPGTIAEALISGLPILLNGNVPCQVGLITMMFILPSSFLEYSSHVQALSALCILWLDG
jgi:1,2-diacylglycerol 3-beta-galactosyltransferase